MNGRPAMLRSCASASGSTGTPSTQALIGAPPVSMNLKLLMVVALLPGESRLQKRKPLRGRPFREGPCSSIGMADYAIGLHSSRGTGGTRSGSMDGRLLLPARSIPRYDLRRIIVRNRVRIGPREYA